MQRTAPYKMKGPEKMVRPDGMIESRYVILDDNGNETDITQFYLSEPVNHYALVAELQYRDERMTTSDPECGPEMIRWIEARLAA